MTKKIALAVSATIVLTSFLPIGYTVSVKVDRPNDKVEPIGRLYDKKYQRNVLKIERRLKSVYELNLFPSLSVSVGMNKNLTWEGVIGFSDLGNL